MITFQSLLSTFAEKKLPHELHKLVQHFLSGKEYNEENFDKFVKLAKDALNKYKPGDYWEVYMYPEDRDIYVKHMEIGDKIKRKRKEDEEKREKEAIEIKRYYIRKKLNSLVDHFFGEGIRGNPRSPELFMRWPRFWDEVKHIGIGDFHETANYLDSSIYNLLRIINENYRKYLKDKKEKEEREKSEKEKGEKEEKWKSSPEHQDYKAYMDYLKNLPPD